ncbi:MAG TPA: aldo/keto reductase, partial [Thermoplasmata archaeon]|nr:aldo/keto reductase [Thermoplasmata archaeon]
MPAVRGAASADGTAAFRDRNRRKLAPHHFRSTAGGLTLSSLGLGSYLGRPDGPTDLQVESAATLCLRSGRVNVLDTAINYRFQRAERSFGRAIARAVDAGTVDREMVFVSTKAGYLAPDAESPIPIDRWVEETLVRPGILAPEEIVDDCHSMAPEFLSDQVERSRRNLGLETIDLVYLHNAPDTQLPIVGREEFLRRLSVAFERLEHLREEGKLVHYGLATWDSLRVPTGHPAHLSLEDAVALARDVGGASHGFGFVQFPFNLGMPEPFSLKNQVVRGTKRSLFDAARELGLGCFTSIPLVQGQLARDGPAHSPLTR